MGRGGGRFWQHLQFLMLSSQCLLGLEIDFHFFLSFNSYLLIVLPGRFYGFHARAPRDKLYELQISICARRLHLSYICHPYPRTRESDEKDTQSKVGFLGLPLPFGVF